MTGWEADDDGFVPRLRGSRGWTWYFTGGELAAAAGEIRDRSAEKMHDAREKWLDALLSRAPKGIKINRSEVDIDSFSIQEFSTSYNYSPVLSEVAQSARSDYERHKRTVSEMHRYAELFVRNATLEYELTLDDVQYFRLFEVGELPSVE